MGYDLRFKITGLDLRNLDMGLRAFSDGSQRVGLGLGVHGLRLGFGSFGDCGGLRVKGFRRFRGFVRSTV